MPSNTPTFSRLIPGIIIVSIQWILWLILPSIFPELLVVGVAAGTIGTLVFLGWWLFFSRYPLKERLGSLGLMILAVFVVSFLIHESVDTGNMGMMYYIYTFPNICLAMILALVSGRKLRPGLRRLVLGLGIILAPGIFIFLRSDGLNGEGRAMINWRWAVTDEERLLASGEDTLKNDTSGTTTGANITWPGFRGPDRDSRVCGSQIETDWEAHPPELLWKQPVGPGCSSFAISGDRAYTQEQRGDLELVSCYNIHTGGIIWTHEDQARFYDSHAGAGPRATPTLQDDCVYTLGGTGILNALDAENGKLIWSRKAAEDAGMEALTWGFCASPLVVGDAVIIALAGKPLAFHKKNGEMIWEGMDGGNSYSSPQLFTIAGIPQVLFMSKQGCRSMDPATGEILWTYDWEISDRILQPAMTGDGKLLLTQEMMGFRCLDVKKTGTQWNLEEIWTSEEMKLNFNDFVIHKGFAYGFDGPSLSCVDLESGIRTWKGKRYRGWILLLPDQDLQIILSEKGELVLAEARPDQFIELARINAIEGKTWNHPAMSEDIILVRNAREMAAYRLPTGSTGSI